MSADADVVIRVENVDAGYEGVAILERINFEIRRGEVFGILGGSGCGKSTLMKHMIGLNPPIAGHVFIGGDDIVTADEATLERIQRKFGVMYQSGALFGSMTLLENVRLPLEVYTTLPDDAIDLVAPDLEVDPLEDRHALVAGVDVLDADDDVGVRAHAAALIC
jgi:phospholipid/cholesterol/gamma-HCH transport system ATP-binding protein